MAWNGIMRPNYRRDGLPHASHTTDEEWALVEPHILPPATDARSRTTNMWDMVNAIFFIAQTGCQWHMLAKDFPPFTTVHRYFYAWRNVGR